MACGFVAVGWWPGVLTVEIEGSQVTLHMDDEGADMLAQACADVKGPSKVFLGSHPFLILRHLDYPIDWGDDDGLVDTSR